MIKIEEINGLIDCEIMGKGIDIISEFGVICAQLVNKEGISREILHTMIDKACDESTVIGGALAESHCKNGLFKLRLLHLMEVKGFKAKDLAEKTGVSESKIKGAMNKGDFPDIPEIEKLANALGVDKFYLLGAPHKK